MTSLQTTSPTSGDSRGLGKTTTADEIIGSKASPVNDSYIGPLVARVNTSFCWLKKNGKLSRIDEPLNRARLTRHLEGVGVAFGVSPIKPGTSTTAVALFDLDSHKGKTPWEEMVSTALRLIEGMRTHGLEPVAFRSSGGKGIHLYTLWEQQQDAYSVRCALTAVLVGSGLKSGTKGVAEGEVEIFPKQDSVPEDGYGSMFILPLAGESVPLDASTLEVMAPDDLIGWMWPMSQPVAKISKPDPRPERVEAPVLEGDLRDLADALAAIPNEDEYELEYDRWRDIIFGIHHATGGSAEGLALAHAFSSRASKYDPTFLDERVWPYIKQERSNPITGRTIFAKAREYEWAPNIDDDFEDLTKEDAAKPAHPTRFEAVQADAFRRRPRPVWIIKGVLPRADLVVLFGESGSGKSFFALDMARAIAQGVDWRGRRVKQGRVLYIAAEGVGGFRNRLEALEVQHGIKLAELPLYVIPDAPNLMEQDDVALARAIKAGGGADVIVVDTFAQVTPGANENSAEDVGMALAHCARLRRATGATLILIHHAGKDLSKGARGWSGLRAAADAEIEVARYGNGERAARLTKLKDGEDGVEFGFRLLPVSLGQDEDGDEVTSCVVEHTEGTRKQAKVREPSGTNQRLVWRTIHNLLDLGGGPAEVDVVLTEAVRQMPLDAGSGRRDRRRETARQALEALAGGQWLRIEDAKIYVQTGAA